MPTKHLTPQQAEESERLGMIAGLKGAAVGLGLGAAATLFAFRRSPDFRALSRPIQSLLTVSGGTAGYLFAADRATTEFENRELGYADEEMLSAIERSRSIPDENLSKTDKALRYLNDNRWSVIGGSWALSMVGALGYSFSNKYLSKQQKLVQARMYAQAVTIAVLMASAGLSMYVGDDEKKTRELPDAQLRAVLEMPDTPQNHLHQQEPKKVHQ